MKPKDEFWIFPVLYGVIAAVFLGVGAFGYYMSPDRADNIWVGPKFIGILGGVGWGIYAFAYTVMYFVPSWRPKDWQD